MKDRKLKGLSDFGWASVAQYLVLVSGYAQLHEINADHVYSFPLSKIGPDKLKARKVKTLSLVVDNKDRLELFVKQLRSELCDEEIVVIRSMYRQFTEWENILTKHIDAVCTFQVVERETYQMFEEVKENELPF